MPDKAKEVIIKISTDASGAAAGITSVQKGLDGLANTDVTKSFKNFKKEISDSNVEFQKLEKEFGTFSKEATTAAAKTTALKAEFKSLSAEVSKVPGDKLNGLVDSAGNATGAVALLKTKIQSLVPGLAGAEGGVKSFGSQLKLLAATPLILILTGIVLVLKFIYEAFQSSVEGGKKLNQTWAGISAVGTQLKDSIFGLVRALTDAGVAAYKFIHLDFAGAAESIKSANKEATESFKQLGNAVTVTMGKFMDLEAQQQINDKARKNQAVTQSETDKLLVQSREILTDETATIKEKKIALAEVTKAETASSVERVRIAKEDLRIANEKAAGLGGEEQKKAKQELRELTISLNEAETANAATGIKLNKQRKLLGRQEVSEAKEASDKIKDISDKAEADNKAKTAQNFEFNNRLRKLNQDSVIALIKDAYAKEVQALNDKIADDNQSNLKEFHSKKISKEQYNLLQAAVDVKSNNERKELAEKHRKEVLEKEEKFQKELTDLQQKAMLDGIVDVRLKEKVQLKITYEAKLVEAGKQYKDDAKKLQIIKDAIDEEFKAENDRVDAKNKLEDDKKKFEQKTKKLDGIIAGKSPYEQKREALDSEQLLIEKAFQNKVITEESYNDKVRELATARKNVAKAEVEAKANMNHQIAAGFITLAGIAGKQSVAGKALAVAGTTIDTIQSGVSAFKGMVAAIPGPVGVALGGVAAAGAVASGYASVKQILAVKVPGSSTAGGSAISNASAPLINAQAAIAPSLTPQDVRVTNSPESSIGRSYIVAGDLDTQAKKSAFLNQLSTY